MKILRSLLAILLFFIVIFVFRGYIKPSGSELNNNPVSNFFGKISDVSSNIFSGSSSSSSSENGAVDNLNNNDGQASTTGGVKQDSVKSVSSSGDKLPPLVGSRVAKSDDNSLSSYGVLVNTNAERKKLSLPGLKNNYLLDKSAEAKLDDMFSNQYFEHTSPSGLGVSDVMGEVDYKFLVAGENLALGNFGGDPQIVAAWMASPGHRANILDKRFTEIGIAVGYGLYKGKKQWLAVQHFARPMSSCPSPNVGLKDQITRDRDSLTSKEVDINHMKAIVDKTESSDPNFQSIVSSYNALVNDYNNSLKNLKTEISNYNEQVKNFNGCLDSVTSLAE